MVNRFLAVLAVFTLLVVLSLACNGLTVVSTPTPTPAPSATHIPQTIHFENDLVEFDYPDTMNQYMPGDPPFVPYPPISLGGELVIAVGDSRSRSISIYHLPIPSDSNLEETMQAAYLTVTHYPLQTGILNANGPVTLAGLPAMQKTYRVFSGEPAYELRDIWTEKDGEAYRVSIWTIYHNPDDLAAFESLADGIINTMQIK